MPTLKIRTHRASILLVPVLTAGLSLAGRPAAAQTFNFVAGVPPNSATNQLYNGPGVLGNYGASTSFFNTVDYNGTGNQNSRLNGSTTNNSTGKDSNGNASTVTISYGADGQFNPNPGFSSGSTTPVALLQNFAHVNKASGQDNITLGGLPALIPYTIVFYGTNGQFGTGGANQFSILSAAGGPTVSTGTTTGDPAGFTGANATTNFVSGVNYLTLTGITSATGNVFASYNATNGGEGDFNALQIRLNPAAAPEPSQTATLGLAVLCLGGLMLRARRRQTA